MGSADPGFSLQKGSLSGMHESLRTSNSRSPRINIIPPELSGEDRGEEAGVGVSTLVLENGNHHESITVEIWTQRGSAKANPEKIVSFGSTVGGGASAHRRAQALGQGRV